MFKRKKFFIGGVILTVAMGFLLYLALNDATPHYETVGDLIDAGSEVHGKVIRVDGWVVDGSIDLDPSSGEYNFEVHDGQKQIAVVYSGTVADTFGDGEGVMITGIIDVDGIDATRVLSQCATKYDSIEH